MGARSAPDATAARFWLRSSARLLARPGLWSTAIRQAARLTPSGWWRRPPFLPVPDRRYFGFRLETQYGRTREADPRDLVAYLEWCRDQQRLRAETAGHRETRR
ncbi:MAG: hypothetical protein E6G60_01465 [Actinobacteria bacterium]|nr:MAG: hypothetical protein E6G60_01465 [Actinomycetota bacterium]